MSNNPISRRDVILNALVTGGGLFAVAAGAQTSESSSSAASSSASFLDSSAKFHCHVEDFGGVANGLSDVFTDNKDPLLAAIASIRSNPRELQQNFGSGSPMITAYSSGTIEFGRGVYAISPDALEIIADLGLRFVGQGSRGKNNSVFGATTLLIRGESSGFGIRTYGNGSRNFQVENMDICYWDSTFTGDLIDNYDSVGLTLKNAYLGTFGIGTTQYPRCISARSLLRQTYDEFTHIQDCVFSGAVDGWWDDDSRSIDNNIFGGSASCWRNVVFYDFTDTMMRSPMSRARETMVLENIVWNPIAQNCNRGVDLQNIINLKMHGFAAPSYQNKASIEWIRVLNCTGAISVECGGLSKAGTLSGNLTLTGSLVGGTDGFTLTSGIIKSFGNKFVSGTNAYLIMPDAPLNIELGADEFGSAVTSSYYLPVDTVDIRGTIHYSPEYDNSSSKFEINSNRVRVVAIDKGLVVFSDSNISIPFTQSGRTCVAGGASNQYFILPLPSHCIDIGVSKFSDAAYVLEVSTPAGKNFMVGQSGTRTKATTTSVGAHISFRAVNSDTYIATSIVGDWTFI